MDNFYAAHEVPNMFGKQNGSQILENAVVFRPVSTTTY
jgi:hypothetical protein